MTVHFYDDAHEAFFREKLERAAASGRTPDNYFRSFLYLCGLCPDTRSHFHRLFDWREPVSYTHLTLPTILQV